MIQGFKDRLGPDFEPIYQRFQERKLFDQLQVGRISDEAFIHAIQQETKFRLSPTEILEIWNRTILTIPARRLSMLAELRAKYKVSLLSNTNSIHLKRIFLHLKKDHGVEDFNNTFFDHVFYSNEINLAKPDPQIYEYVMDETGMQPEEILFIDDLEENTIQAQIFGWNTITHNSEEEIVEVMSGFLR
jgi:putative hydrolase of the HAD superfamily